MEDRVLILEHDTVKREGPLVERIRTVEDAILAIKSNTTAIRRETDKSFTHTQAYIVIAIMLANLITTIVLAAQH